MDKGYVELKDPKYQRWINENVEENCQQQCVRHSKAMADVFPNLRVVGMSGMLNGHAWCVDKDDKVVDPTSHQFSNPFQYTIRLELDDFPIGKCSWCGGEHWKDTPGVRRYMKVIGDNDETIIGKHNECITQMNEEYKMEVQ